MRRRELHVIDGQPCLLQPLAHPIQQRSGRSSRRRGRSQVAQGRRQGQRLLPLTALEIAVAGAEGQIALAPHGGAALHRQRQTQIGHHPPQDHQLLPVLFAQEQPVGAHQRQQAADHGGHPIEMARSRAATQLPLQRNGRQDARTTLRAVGIDDRELWCEQSLGAGLSSQLPVALQITGIALEVLPGAELQRVHEDAEQHPRAPTGQRVRRAPQQRLVPPMQGPHGGNEMERPIRLQMAPAQQLGSGAQQPHNKKRSNRQSDGWTVGRKRQLLQPQRWRGLSRSLRASPGPHRSR